VLGGYLAAVADASTIPHAHLVRAARIDGQATGQAPRSALRTHAKPQLTPIRGSRPQARQSLAARTGALWQAVAPAGHARWNRHSTARVWLRPLFRATSMNMLSTPRLPPRRRRSSTTPVSFESLVSASSMELGSLVERYVATTVHSQLASALRSLQGDTIEKPRPAPAAKPRRTNAQVSPQGPGQSSSTHVIKPRRRRAPRKASRWSDLDFRDMDVYALNLEHVRGALARVVDDYALSGREGQILAASVHGVPRAHLRDALGVTENTVKTQVRSLIAKLGRRTIDDAIWWFRSQVTADGQPSRSQRRARA